MVDAGYARSIVAGRRASAAHRRIERVRRARELTHASRYFRALEKMEDGDTVVLAECLNTFEIAHSGVDANADASSSIATATFMISGLVIALLQAVHALGRENVRVVVVTSNAFVASDESELDGSRDGHVSHAPVMAMLRVLRREHPNIDFATLDVPRDDERASTEGLERALRRIVDDESAFAEREIAVNDVCASVPRLRRASPPRVDANAATSFGRGACVIVGGIGALGLMHLSFFVETFDIRRFVLVGRSVRDVDAVHRAIARARGLEICVVAADCCDEDQCRAVFALAAPVSVTLHLAGVLHEAAAVDVTRASFIDAVEAKIIGSLNIFERLLKMPSAVAVASTSIFGSVGQTKLTCYAAANAFQDALCAVCDRSTSSGPRRVVRAVGNVGRRRHGGTRGRRVSFVLAQRRDGISLASRRFGIRAPRDFSRRRLETDDCVFSADELARVRQLDAHARRTDRVHRGVSASARRFEFEQFEFEQFEFELEFEFGRARVAGARRRRETRARCRSGRARRDTRGGRRPAHVRRAHVDARDSIDG